jgi:hypothetical protein
MKNHGNKGKNDIDNGHIHDHKVRYKQEGVMGEKPFSFISRLHGKKRCMKRKDMDVIEHERLFNFQLYTWTQIKVNKQWFYCCSTFPSHYIIN